MYIYESHMGSFYTSKELLDSDVTYCETCGDSDYLIGEAETIEDAWKLLKDKTDIFDSSVCENCEHKEDYDYCDNECESYEHSGGFSLKYVMEFLFEEFKTDKKPHYIYLIPKHKDGDKEYLYVNVQPKGYKFGDRHSFLSTVSLFEEFVPKLASELCIFLNSEKEDTFKKIKTVELKDKFVHIFICEEESEIYETEDWNNKASYQDEDWYGYINLENLKVIDEEKEILEYIK